MLKRTVPRTVAYGPPCFLKQSCKTDKDKMNRKNGSETFATQLLVYRFDLIFSCDLI